VSETSTPQNRRRSAGRVRAPTNRRYSDVADANGNLYQNGVVAYDVENRVAEANGVKYAYSPDNLRIWRGSFSLDELTVYSMGQKLGAYNLSVNNGALVATCTGYYEYFGGKLLKNAQGYVNQDRLGSIGKYFPYGQERPSATTNGKEKFATYTRDAETGLDYAQNRYHSSGDGRFLSPDPYVNSAGVGDPGSWNRYAYVGGDPVTFSDPRGLCKLFIGGTNYSDSSSCDSVSVSASRGPSGVEFFGYGIAAYLGNCRGHVFDFGEGIMIDCFAYHHDEACSIFGIGCPAPPPESRFDECLKAVRTAMADSVATAHRWVDEHIVAGNFVHPSVVQVPYLVQVTRAGYSGALWGESLAGPAGAALGAFVGAVVATAAQLVKIPFLPIARAMAHGAISNLLAGYTPILEEERCGPLRGMP
jgi:RHS repeat-associated protein